MSTSSVTPDPVAAVPLVSERELLSTYPHEAHRPAWDFAVTYCRGCGGLAGPLHSLDSPCVGSARGAVAR